MGLGRYGPFADVVAVASALVVTFSVLLQKMVGRISRWSWLASGSPPFLIKAPARAVAVALMAITYVVINKSNYLVFGAAAAIAAALDFIVIGKFNRMRLVHVASIAVVGIDGKQQVNWRKKTHREKCYNRY